MEAKSFLRHRLTCRAALLYVFLCSVLLVQAAGARAQDPGRALAETPPPPRPQEETLTGDWGGVRARLAEAGLRISLDHASDLLGTVRGGMRRGSAYQGRIGLALDLDLEAAAGWPGARLHAGAFQIHGRGPSEHYVGNLLTVSGIEAAPSTRLFTLWLEQDFLGGLASLRVGQLAADEEFLVSEQATLFVNASFGWPGITAENLPAGGPAYPLATPGLRLRIGEAEGLSLAVGVFNGDPAGGRDGDPQRANRTGLLFPVGDDAFVIAELARRREAGPAGLPASFKLGGWYHSGAFEDLRGDPAAPVTRRGNAGAYAIADVMLWRKPGHEEGGLGAFLRVGTAPGARNPVGFYLDGGLTWAGPFEGRPDDVLGLGIAHARISDAARQRDREAAPLDAQAPLRSAESVVELTYAAQLAPWWTLQPTAQLVLRPGAEAAARNAMVIGLRSVLRF